MFLHFKFSKTCFWCFYIVPSITGEAFWPNVKNSLKMCPQGSNFSEILLHSEKHCRIMFKPVNFQPLGCKSLRNIVWHTVIAGRFLLHNVIPFPPWGLLGYATAAERISVFLVLCLLGLRLMTSPPLRVLEFWPKWLPADVLKTLDKVRDNTDADTEGRQAHRLKIKAPSFLVN